jgi:hypothetical protein
MSMVPIITSPSFYIGRRHHDRLSMWSDQSKTVMRPHDPTATTNVILGVSARKEVGAGAPSTSLSEEHHIGVSDTC